jgi:predicted GNAT family acetyltransferase
MGAAILVFVSLQANAELPCSLLTNVRNNSVATEFTIRETKVHIVKEVDRFSNYFHSIDNKSSARSYNVVETKSGTSQARLFFRYFRDISLMSIDLVRVPIELRGKGLGQDLIARAIESVPSVNRVRIILDYSNLIAFKQSSKANLIERFRETATGRQLIRMGYSSIEYFAWIELPDNETKYPEFVLTKAP